MEDKKRILIGSINRGGVCYHRLFLPYNALRTLYKDEYEVVFGYNRNMDNLVEYVKTFDFFVFNRIEDIDLLRSIKGSVRIICDIDDYWVIPQEHPSYPMYRLSNGREKMEECIEISDYITCTTPIIAGRLRDRFHKPVFEFNNGLTPDGQFSPVPHSNSRVKVGIVCGASHTKDMELLDGLVQQMPRDLLDKLQICLCGFDKTEYILGDGSRELVGWNEPNNLWGKWERMLTLNYSTVSKEHRDYLHEFKVEDRDFGEAYMRKWTRSVEEYAHHYDDLDILLVPLVKSDFNACKSELKFIEAGVKGVAVIASNVAPYTLCGVSAIGYGGVINADGNCILVDNNKGLKGWIRAIKRLVEDEDLRANIAINNLKVVVDRYNLVTITQRRRDWLNEITSD